jgi:hypothetical protein
MKLVDILQCYSYTQPASKLMIHRPLGPRLSPLARIEMNIERDYGSRKQLQIVPGS